MTGHGLKVAFIFMLSLTSELVDAEWIAVSVAFTSNTGNRPHIEIIPQEYSHFTVNPNSGDAELSATDSYKIIKSTHICEMNLSADLWFEQIPMMYKLQKRLCDKDSKCSHSEHLHLQSHCIGAHYVKDTTGCSEHVSAITNFCASLFKIATSIWLNDSESNGLKYQHKTSAKGNKSYNHNMIMLGCETKHNYQSIVIMEEDPSVTESATYLFERYANVSTLLMYHKGALRVLKGVTCPKTKISHIILVGHGSKGNNEVAKLGGSGPEELARVVSTIAVEKGPLHTISLISCNLGNDLSFVMLLLQALKSLNVESKLQLYNSIVSVTPDGMILTKHDEIWRYNEGSSTVMAVLDNSGKLLTTAGHIYRGRVIPDYVGKALYFHSLEWPNHPQMFVPEELRKKYTSIDCLEGLTWSLFFEENEKRRAPDYVAEDTDKYLKAIWLKEPETKADDIKMKHITSILDLLIEIRYNAREEATSDLYYVLNDCIYMVEKTTFRVSLVGKFIKPNDQNEAQNFLDAFNDQNDQFSLQELRIGLKASKFIDFCRQTFQVQQCTYNCEHWGHYFMVAVFSASVHNFRTFSLFLMSVIACEVSHLEGTESSLCTAFVEDDHPMATDYPWPELKRRGFYGCTTENFEIERQDRLAWLDKVVAKENALYAKSQEMMSIIDHNQETELDVFGRVKVMNKYAFSSYLEFFRGTPEGKKLKRGCTPS